MEQCGRNFSTLEKLWRERAKEADWDIEYGMAEGEW